MRENLILGGCVCGACVCDPSEFGCSVVDGCVCTPACEAGSDGAPPANGVLAALIRQRDAALRDLDRFDRTDKGSRWITEPDKGRRLGARVRELDAQIEAATR